MNSIHPTNEVEVNPFTQQLWCKKCLDQPLKDCHTCGKTELDFDNNFDAINPKLGVNNRVIYLCDECKECKEYNECKET